LAKIGLVDSIYDAATEIDFGRKGFAIEGMERKGRILYEDGIDRAMTAFKKAQTSADPYTVILAEYTFISQELQMCDKTDIDTLNSLTQAIQSFDDAFLILKVVDEKKLYHIADKAIPHHKKHRIIGFPRDAFHIACSSHRTRLKNILRTPRLDPIEKALLKQRSANLSVAKNGYIEKQKKALKSDNSENVTHLA